MNKIIYKLLKKFFQNLQEMKKQRVRTFLEKNLTDEEVMTYNIQLDSNYSENEIKFIELNVNRTLFTQNEYNYYKNLLSLKRFIKK